MRICLDHVPFDIGEGATNFFPGIKDVLRVENLLGLGEKCRHFGSEEHWQVRRTDDAVIVLTSDRAMEFMDQRIDLHGQFQLRPYRSMVLAS